MNKTEKIVILIFLTGISLLIASFTLFHSTKNPVSLSRNAEKVIALRMRVLDSYMSEALSRDPHEWMDLKAVPGNMVIYRYVNDSLQSWCHQFTVFNDDIKQNVELPCLVNPKIKPLSPLSGLTESVSFINMGPNWYLVKAFTRDNVQVIGGLRIDEDDRKLRLFGKFSIKPLETAEGAAVNVDGVPQFKIIYSSLQSGRNTNIWLLWLSLALIIGSVMLFLYLNRTLGRFAIASFVVLVTMVAMYFWGRIAPEGVRVFSPAVYADGDFLYSLGAVFVINFTIMLMILTLYMVRDDIAGRMSTKRSCLLGMVLTVCLISGIVSYVSMTLRSIALNSNISLDLYKVGEISSYTVIVYLATIGVLMCILLLLNMLREPLRQAFGRDINFQSSKLRVVFSAAVGIYVVILTSIFGVQKENARVGVWASRLGFERDISLEMQLRMAEQQIAGDVLISSLSILDHTESTILNRICESYLAVLYQNYDMRVLVFNGSESDSEQVVYYNQRLTGAEPVADGSRFVYSVPAGGQICYTGVFIYYTKQYGVTRVVLCVDPIGDIEYNGYASILGRVPPGKVLIPLQYSYARYKDDDLLIFRGDYAYPTTVSADYFSRSGGPNGRRTIRNGYLHFVNNITDDDVVIISRKANNFLEYLIAVVLVAVVAFLLSYFTVRRRNVEKIFEKNYYKQRITAVLMASLLLTLVSLAGVSVMFVYKRNSDNQMRMMSDKINSIQALVQARVRNARSTADLTNPEVFSLIENVSQNTGSDITLYSPGGRVFMSTIPELYEMMLLDNRMSEDAYSNIVFNNRRYYISRTQNGTRKYSNMYAPLINSNGDIIAILCSPYIDEAFDFRNDAVLHLMAIFAVFLILLLMSRFLSETVVDRMFMPLIVMGRKMSAANIESLEQIDYDRDDEISTLVNAYNRMVVELSESTRKLAQAERDKAWSGMARQVAHEIKNPLTPMKLQIQRIMRLKDKGDSRWQEKFDEVMKVLLDHIDILSDTATEFSTFAKLYSEEPVEVDLNKMIRDEISMFDNRDNITFDYFGLSNSFAMAPKPQLTRVFVNLINNSVQAIDNRPDGRIMVSLRNSTHDGYYDIVVEDNGPGVDAENVEKLFTPNFTTKSSGSGLGLAISRSILEKCGASISYKRSFNLGGACFTILFPK